MRPSLRLERIRSPSPNVDLILGSNSPAGKAGLAPPAGHPPVPIGFGPADRPAAGPGEPDELGWQRGGELGLAGRVHRVDPLHFRLAELAGAVALVERLEHAALACRAVLDIGVAR